MHIHLFIKKSRLITLRLNEIERLYSNKNVYNYTIIFKQFTQVRISFFKSLDDEEHKN